MKSQPFPSGRLQGFAAFFSGSVGLMPLNSQLSLGKRNELLRFMQNRLLTDSQNVSGVRSLKVLASGEWSFSFEALRISIASYGSGNRKHQVIVLTSFLPYGFAMLGEIVQVSFQGHLWSMLLGLSKRVPVVTSSVTLPVTPLKGTKYMTTLSLVAIGELSHDGTLSSIFPCLPCDCPDDLRKCFTAVSDVLWSRECVVKRWPFPPSSSRSLREAFASSTLNTAS